MFTISVVVFFSIFSIIYSQNVKLCDNLTVNSAFTYKDNVYLFRDQQFWIFSPKKASVTETSRNINQLIEGYN